MHKPTIHAAYHVGFPHIGQKTVNSIAIILLRPFFTPTEPIGMAEPTVNLGSSNEGNNGHLAPSKPLALSKIWRMTPMVYVSGDSPLADVADWKSNCTKDMIIPSTSLGTTWWNVHEAPRPENK